MNDREHEERVECAVPLAQADHPQGEPATTTRSSGGTHDLGNPALRPPSAVPAGERALLPAHRLRRLRVGRDGIFPW